MAVGYKMLVIIHTKREINMNKFTKNTISIILCIIMCAAIFTACKDETEDDPDSTPSIESTEPTSDIPETPLPTEIWVPSDDSYQFTEDNFPRIDGSTATIPLIEAVTSALLSKPRSEINVSVSKTSGAYIALAENETDILLVYDGGDETRAQVNADELFETVSIGKDALVFIVNRDNPVDNLTKEQVQRIFTGEYTNWSELGGSDEPIRAFQRGEGSGSQALMDKLVMPGLTMADPAKVMVVESMGGLMEAVADFAGGPTGIGYNVYFYVTEMRGNDYVKILSIDSVYPNYDTIQSEEYPFVSDFYSVIRKGEAEDSPARALHEWIQTDEGQNLIASENYVSLRTNPEVDTPYVDSKYSLYPSGEKPEYFGGVDPYLLTARDDYGELYFYLGVRRTDEWSVPRFYGLCNSTGLIITEPIYSVPLLLTDSEGNKAYFCYRSDKMPNIETVEMTDYWSYERIHYPVLIFATDGSWVKEFDGGMPYYGFRGATDDIVNNDIFAVMENGKWGAVNMNGEIVIPFERENPEAVYEFDRFSEIVDGFDIRYFLCVTGNRYLTLTGGLSMPTELYDKEGNLIASTGMLGRPVGMPGVYFATYEWIDEHGVNVYTYTLDGEPIAKLSSSDELSLSYAEIVGDYVWVTTETSNLVCDMELNILYEYPKVFDETREAFFSRFVLGPNVLYETDRDSFYHRTYLPDGTRLVTWYDPDIT